jgi:hypothetical protein
VKRAPIVKQLTALKSLLSTFAKLATVIAGGFVAIVFRKWLTCNEKQRAESVGTREKIP